MKYDTITEAQWTKLPAHISPTERGKQEWKPLLDELRAGNVVSIPCPDYTRLRSLRARISRRATNAGFRVEFRWNNGKAAFRRADLPTHQILEEMELPVVPTRRRRKAKQMTAP